MFFNEKSIDKKEQKVGSDFLSTDYKLVKTPLFMQYMQKKAFTFGYTSKLDALKDWLNLNDYTIDDGTCIQQLFIMFEADDDNKPQQMEKKEH